MRLLLCAATLLAAACGSSVEVAAVVLLEIPAAPGSLAPDLSVGADGVPRLSWIEPVGEGLHALRFSELEGERWSPAREIARGAGWFVNWADVPTLCALADGTLAASWLERIGAEPHGYGARVVLSVDGGASWSEPRWLHSDSSEVEHGFVSLAPFGADTFGSAWLDGRAASSQGGGHGGAMQLRGRTLRRDGSRSPDMLLDPRVCDCCPTELVRALGNTLIAYRDRGEDEVRDIGLISLGSSGPVPRLLHPDGWSIEGCPVNGPALDVHGALVGAAWYTEGAGPRRVQVAFSRDGGEAFDAPRGVSGAEPFGSVDAAFGPDGALWVSWLEAETGAEGAWLLRRVDPGGALGATYRLVPSVAERAAGIARLVRHGQGLLFAWTEVGPDGSTRVRCARVELSDG